MCGNDTLGTRALCVCACMFVHRHMQLCQLNNTPLLSFAAWHLKHTWWTMESLILHSSSQCMCYACIGDITGDVIRKRIGKHCCRPSVWYHRHIVHAKWQRSRTYSQTTQNVPAQLTAVYHADVCVSGSRYHHGHTLLRTLHPTRTVTIVMVHASDGLGTFQTHSM